MKKIVSFMAAAILVATMMTTSSCTKTCDAGYEGSDCKTQVRAKYYGNWSISGTDNAVPQGTYTNKDLTIAAGSTSSVFTLRMTSIGLGLVLNATMGATGTSFTVDQATTGGYQYSGTGSFTTSSAMTLNLTEVNTNVTPNVTTLYSFTGTK
jgi:hypothetical protein